ncbi:MAG: phospho-N-acetylmuramoyl-pentapeptide-transferase [Acutalibacteraceae bacterium]
MNFVAAIIVAVAVAFAISALLGTKMVPWLHKLKFGQTILDIGPNWHKKKQGTPTMGGLMFIIATIVTFLIVVLIDVLMHGDLVGTTEAAKSLGVVATSGAAKAKIWGGLIMALGFGIIGFADDYIKIKKKQNEGLTVIQKTVLQLILIAAYIVTLILSGNTYMYLPLHHSVWDYGNLFWFVVITAIVMYATVNAVNFTDGIDGLCGSVTITAAVAFGVMAFMRSYLGASVLAAALAGALGGYLIWNWHPAKCFMGDTGSMFLGGMMIALAYDVDCPLILLLAGIIYVIEGGSDVIQILYFKTTRKIAQRKDPNATGKRLFKMAPIHHSFELSGWSEEKICVVFSLVNLVGGFLSCLIFYLDK